MKLRVSESNYSNIIVFFARLSIDSIKVFQLIYSFYLDSTLYSSTLNPRTLLFASGKLLPAVLYIRCFFITNIMITVITLCFA